MKLIEALRVAKSVEDRNVEALSCFLAAGLNPLHLKSLLIAELGLAFPDLRIQVHTGLYGDLAGNVERLGKCRCEFGIVLIEWPDLDPRLGIRSSAKWTEAELPDILSNAKAKIAQIQVAVEAISQRAPVILSFPTLPLPPLSCVPGWQAGVFEMELRSAAQCMAASIARNPRVRILSPERMDLISPLQDRHDIEAEISSGFPYRLSHASAIATGVAQLARRRAAKKGLITDLDDTLWRGILGEDGIEGISWDLEHRSQNHAFYQRFLGALASEGVLLAAATRNDPALAAEALGRNDLALSSRAIFPVEAHWKAKSQSVARILEVWNIAPDSVVFVDDSALEIAEVQSVFPEIHCLQFPTLDNGATCALIGQLRELFGKAQVMEEDTLRLDSIRQFHSSELPASTKSGFSRQIGAEITFNLSRLPIDPRALELVNKTNQFNLNGRRYSEASWTELLLDPTGFAIVASYRDKFGPLGKIAVLAGYVRGRKLSITTWVMSCRAFSRRIEHKCLAKLLSSFDFDELEFDFFDTQRNAPLREFLTELLGATPSPHWIVSRSVLESRLAAIADLQEVVYG